ATYRTLDDGTYTFTVVASDAATNTSTSTWTFTVDTHAPDAPTIIGDTTQGIHPAFTFSDNETVTYACTLDSLTTPCDTSGWTATVSGGSHTLSVVSTDLAGNSSAAGSVVFDAVGVAPDPPVFDTKPAALSNSTAFTWHDDDAS